MRQAASNSAPIRSGKSASAERSISIVRKALSIKGKFLFMTGSG